MDLSNKVIFFDGVCGLCNGFVDFVIKIDRGQKFIFSPLQSEYAKEKLPSEFTSDLRSIVLLNNGRLYTKSNAVLEVVKEIGGLWNLFLVGKILPRNIRDWFYDIIAENRYQLFGKKESCRLPSPEERKRFII